MSDNLLDLTVGLEVGKGFPGERAVDLQAVDKGGNGDEAVRLDILLELVVGLLVENDGVLGLVLDCTVVSGNSALRIVERSRESCKRGPNPGKDFERVGILAICV